VAGRVIASETMSAAFHAKFPRPFSFSMPTLTAIQNFQLSNMVNLHLPENVRLEGESLPTSTAFVVCRTSSKRRKRAHIEIDNVVKKAPEKKEMNLIKLITRFVRPVFTYGEMCILALWSRNFC
jgi:hypothetical protein